MSCAEAKRTVEKMEVDSSYHGLKYVSGKCTSDFCQDLMEQQSKQQPIPKKFAYQIVLDMIEMLKESSTLVDIDVPEKGEVTVCGDVHGQFYDLLKIFSLNGVPSQDNPYLFNGDFVDRGSFSVEVILTLFAWKLAFPNHMHLARGNHETRGMNTLYGFEREVREKYGDTMYSLFCEAFCWLPLCHVINHQVFVVHGGLSQYNVTLDDIRRVNRECDPPRTGLMTDLLWSDPHVDEGISPSKRGAGVAFGPDVTQNFLKVNSLKMIIRSHEHREEGYSMEHNDQLITVFSAPNYCGKMGNKGAFIKLDGKTLTPKVITFAWAGLLQSLALQALCRHRATSVAWFGAEDAQLKMLQKPLSTNCAFSSLGIPINDPVVLGFVVSQHCNAIGVKSARSSWQKRASKIRPDKTCIHIVWILVRWRFWYLWFTLNTPHQFWKNWTLCFSLDHCQPRPDFEDNETIFWRHVNVNVCIYLETHALQNFGRFPNVRCSPV